jgi:NADPH-dependent glutamate synthase beta subunit-like oxidoreductase
LTAAVKASAATRAVEGKQLSVKAIADATKAAEGIDRFMAEMKEVEGFEWS